MDQLLAADPGSATRVHFCTVHSIVEAQSNEALRAAFGSADMVATDGVPLVWVVRGRGVRHAERVCGPDVMLSLCDRGRASGLRHYFVGGQPGVPEQLAARLTARFPGLLVVGTESPPFRSLSDAEDAALVARINEARADVVWVGLGSPKQELWAADHQVTAACQSRDAGGCCVRLPQRTPSQACSRLDAARRARVAVPACDGPASPVARYVVTNSKFVVLVAKEEIKRRRSRRTEPKA